MAFESDIDDLVVRLNRRELDAPEASELIMARVNEELGARVATTPMASLRQHIDIACARHFGSDCADKSFQTFLSRQVIRSRKGRLAAPQVEGEVVWI